MNKQHSYTATTTWTGNKGSGTTDYRSYDRQHVIGIEGKPDLACSSDPAFRGDKHKHNPEDLLVASLSGCHMLWFLHLCAENGVVVTRYRDVAIGTMNENKGGSGQFSEVILHPVVTVKEPSMIEKANALHDQAHAMCFIVRSVNFQVLHKPTAAAEK